MDTSAYARAAGIQSEMNKVTLTRVAGNEVGYNRLLQLYKNNTRLKINKIAHEQGKLRKAYVGYSRKLRQNQRERYLRLQRENEFDDKQRSLMSVTELDEWGGEEDSEGESELECGAEEQRQGNTVGDQHGLEPLKEERNNTHFGVITHERNLTSGHGRLVTVGETNSLENNASLDNNSPLLNNNSPLLNNNSPLLNNNSPLLNNNSPPMMNNTPSRINNSPSLINNSPLLNTRGKDDTQTLERTRSSIAKRMRRFYLGSGQQDRTTNKLLQQFERMVLQNEDGESGSSRQRVSQRLPDTRDNIYFQGAHGIQNSSYNLIRLASVIYPNNYGYGDQSEREKTKPQLNRITSRAQKRWQLIKQKQVKQKQVTRRPTLYWNKISKDIKSYSPKLLNRSVSHIGPTQSTGEGYRAHSPRRQGRQGQERSSGRVRLPPLRGPRVSADIRPIAQTQSGNRQSWHSVIHKLKLIPTLGNIR